MSKAEQHNAINRLPLVGSGAIHLKVVPKDETDDYGYVWLESQNRFVPNSPLGSPSQSSARHKRAQELTIRVHELVTRISYINRQFYAGPGAAG